MHFGSVLSGLGQIMMLIAQIDGAGEFDTGGMSPSIGASTPVPASMASATISDEIGPILLTRWLWSGALASPEVVEQARAGLIVWLIALAALLGLAVLVQGPSRAFGQLIQVPGHFALLSRAARRLGRAWLLVMVVMSVVIVSWVGYQTVAFFVEAELARSEVLTLTKSRSVWDIALDRGAHTALIPLRDVLGLGGYMLLVLFAIVRLFGLGSERWDERSRSIVMLDRSASTWATIGWVAASLYFLERGAMLIGWTQGLPLGGPPTWILVQGLLTPVLRLICDGILLSWVLVQLGAADPGQASEAPPVDVSEVARMIPMTCLACLLAMPGQYLALPLLVLYNVIDLSSLLGAPPIVGLLQWIRRFQAFGLLTWVVIAAAATSRGQFRLLLAGVVAVFRAEGARLVALVGLLGLAAGSVAAAGYVLLLSLGGPSWSITAAEAYIHYGTTAVGLLGVAALVDLGEAHRPRPRVTPKADKILASSWSPAEAVRLPERPVDPPPLPSSGPAKPHFQGDVELS